MILLDYSAVAIASIMISIKMEGEQLSEAFALHMIMNSIRTFNKKFSNEYKPMIICCDGKENWRKEVFPFYKYKRRKDKDKSDVDWELIYKCLDYAKEEIRDGFPYLVIEIDNAEADDIIGALAKYATEWKEKTVIVSNDKDFVQTHSDYVSQYRPCESGFMNIPRPDLQLRELIIRGDADDGIPNIKSPDAIFTMEGVRQKPIFAKDVEKWVHDERLSFLTDETRDNYYRNEMLIDLDFTPNEIREEAINRYLGYNERPNKMKMTRFFMNNRLRNLHEKINDFM